MDAGIALEIRRNGLRGNFLALREFAHALRIQLEAAEVVGKIQHTVSGQAIHAGAQQAHVFTLDIEVLGTRRIGEGRRVAEDHVVAVLLRFQPAQRIGLHQTMLGTGESVQ